MRKPRALTISDKLSGKMAYLVVSEDDLSRHLAHHCNYCDTRHSTMFKRMRRARKIKGRGRSKDRADPIFGDVALNVVRSG